MIFTPDEPQRRIREHLMRCPHAMLFVGMGLGKTASCLATLVEMLQEGMAHGALIIAPLRVCNLTWPMEVSNWEQFSWLRVANLRTAAGQKAFMDGTAHLYLINYESIPAFIRLAKKRLKARGTLPYDIALYDESTKAKNPGSKRINQLRRHVPRVPRNWALTGTPAPNSMLDLFAQVRLVDGGKRLGEVYSAYQGAYFDPADWNGYTWKLKPGMEQTIEHKIHDITLTLHSRDWLDIPDTVLEDVEVPLGDKLQKQYREFEKEMVMQLELGEITAPTAAALVTKLAQFTSGRIYDGDRVVHTLHSLKVDALKRLVEKHGNEPMLVGVAYMHEYDVLRENFPQAEFVRDFKSKEAQTDMLNRWNRGEIEMLVAHPRSCGHGLNMQYGCKLLTWFSLTYDRECYDQMLGRLYRRGQKESVTMYRLMCPGTVDDAVAEALTMKAEGEARLLKALAMLESFRERTAL
jgi:SNF2 family DNA or RNA helicase